MPEWSFRARAPSGVQYACVWLSVMCTLHFFGLKYEKVILLSHLNVKNVLSLFNTLLSKKIFFVVCINIENTLLIQLFVNFTFLVLFSCSVLF